MYDSESVGGIGLCTMTEKVSSLFHLHFSHPDCLPFLYSDRERPFQNGLLGFISKLDISEPAIPDDLHIKLAFLGSAFPKLTLIVYTLLSQVHYHRH